MSARHLLTIAHVLALSAIACRPPSPTPDVSADDDVLVDDFAAQLPPGCSDADRDGHLVGASCEYPAGVTTDCDDTNASVWASCALCGDRDGDGLKAGCDAYPATIGGDCDDGDPSVGNSPEIPLDGLDQNCDGVDLVPSESNGLFVTTTGDDAAAGTRAAPMATVRAAAARAAGDPRYAGYAVFLAEGAYDDTLANNWPVSVHGGFDAASWTRTVNRSVVRRSGTGPLELFAGPKSAWSGVELRVEAPGANAVVVSVKNVDWACDDCLITNAAGASTSLIGVSAAEGARVTLRGSTVALAGTATASATGVQVDGAATLVVLASTVSTGDAAATACYGVRSLRSPSLTIDHSTLTAGACATSVAISAPRAERVTIADSKATALATTSSVAALLDVGRADVVRSVLEAGDAASESIALALSSAAESYVMNSVLVSNDATSSLALRQQIDNARKEQLHVRSNVLAVMTSTPSTTTGLRIESLDGSSTRLDVVNNIFVSTASAGTRYGLMLPATTTLGEISYNLFASDVGMGYSCVAYRGTTCMDLSALNAAYGHNLSGAAELDASWHISATSAAQGAGRNNRNYGLAMPDELIDRDREARPRVGVWDIGPDEAP